MSTVMNASEFVNKARDIAENYKTIYILGCFGAPMNAKNKKRYSQNNDYNKKSTRSKKIQAASEDTFGFDCACLIKGILWGWNGNVSKTYGGATYKSHGVPDLNADSMIKVCTDISTDFTNIEPGEMLWTSGHAGIYLGDGLAVESTPNWKDGVQITACNCTKSGYRSRNWKKHGKLPYIKYDTKTIVKPTSNTINDEKIIWDYLFEKIGNSYGVAGLMGNLYAESALRSNNLQNSYEKKLGFIDEIYTASVDNGTYANFVRDGAGYGLAQWTHWSRKEALFKYVRNKNKSIGDLTTQLEFLYKELSESYKSVLSALKNATSVRNASDIVLTKYERPANQSESVQIKRAGYGQKYYDKYADKNKVEVPTSTKPSTTSKVDSAQKKDTSLAGDYKVTASGGLHIRTGASSKKKSLGILKGGSVVTNYGYYSVASNGVKWLYVKTIHGIVGFCSSRYLKKC